MKIRSNNYGIRTVYIEKSNFGAFIHYIWFFPNREQKTTFVYNFSTAIDHVKR